MAKVLNDAQRLNRHRPQAPWKLQGGRSPTAFWQKPGERWAMIAVLCFAWEHLATCWDSMLDPKRLDSLLEADEVEEVRAFGRGRRQDMRDFAAFLREHQAQVGVAPIIREDLWIGVMPLWFFRAAWPLARRS